ncbi:hypothetical protein EC844_10234 [Acinetobacter calcoaceticus]|uniref:Uncharacterized protein n=1 Tax=Acinetobacter calcoaceticus TaxID=471 RepID=A0A4R1Y492_ACICA|nr:hypothetical protein EC844_10234 [Acinetobacter calcoaceticus]
MTQTVYFIMQASTQQQFQQIHQALNAGTEQRQAKVLGRVLADLACEVIDQAFAVLLRTPGITRSTSVEDQQAQASEKVVSQILAQIRKYMPYAVSMFANDRLLPMVNYLEQSMFEIDGRAYLSYRIPDRLSVELLQKIDQIRAGDERSVVDAFRSLVTLIDTGVDALIVHPKQMLKFNLIINKTLDGVIHVCTRMGYQRLEKVASQLTAPQAIPYLDHFVAFIQQPSAHSAQATELIEEP